MKNDKKDYFCALKILGRQQIDPLAQIIEIMVCACFRLSFKRLTKIKYYDYSIKCRSSVWEKSII